MSSQTSCLPTLSSQLAQSFSDRLNTDSLEIQKIIDLIDLWYAVNDGKSNTRMGFFSLVDSFGGNPE